MPKLTELIGVLEVLAPLVEETYTYLYGGGEKPEFMTTLPATMRSRVAMTAAAKRAR